MTYIEDTRTFAGLPQIYLITSDFNIISLGFYDPEYTRDTEFSYQPGKFTKPDGSPHDAIYKDKQCMILVYKHPLFGNSPGWRDLIGHQHIKYIVSTSLIRPHEVLRADPETKDIYLFADLARNPAITIGDKPQETLYEITPHLTPEQLARLPKEIKFATKMQEKMYKLESEKFELETKLILSESMAVAAQASAFLLQEEIKSVLTTQQVNAKKFTRLQLLTGERLVDTIEGIEATHFLNTAWDTKNNSDATKMLEETQASIRSISATIKLMGSLTEAQKYQILMQTVNVVGLEFAQRHIHGIEQYPVSTATGMERLTISKEPTPQELILHYGKLYENKQMKFEDYQNAVFEAVSRDRERMKKSDSPNASVQASRTELLKTIAPEQQVPYGR